MAHQHAQHAPDHVAMGCRHAMSSAVRRSTLQIMDQAQTVLLIKKPSVSEKVRYCNSIDCLADWDTQELLLVSTSYF